MQQLDLSLALELLRQLQTESREVKADLEAIKAALEDLKLRADGQHQYLGLIHNALIAGADRHDRVEGRMRRVEERLGLLSLP